MQKELAKTYDPQGIEDRIYKNWEEKKYFHAEVDHSKTPFTIVIPPPNITGQLHMGHALDNTLQDILIRYKRMQGYNALWQPGTDHASIATEVKVIDSLREQGIEKADLGREGFLEKCWDWRREYGGRIVNQLKKLGSSCDWDRERFTMDEGCNKAVTEVFCKMHKKGWIYKGSRIINWCPVCKTSISDAEVQYEEQNGHFWHIKYPLIEDDGSISTTRFLEFATTRPETMLGDTAVAVHPEDERYADLIGKKVWLPFVDRQIPIVADTYVDREFGTGVVKITPAHDPNDFEVGRRHNLPEINIMNDDATINKNGAKFEGMDRYEARKQIVKELEEMGMFAEEYKQPIPKYARTIGVVTAPTGAAVQDIRNIAGRRNPYVQLILYPALVQGEGAAPSIVNGIHALEHLGVDVIIVGRGGGSIEDLWAFNEEIVARAIFECSVPVISAVGHQTDWTIADYVADLRAPTPSAAAELAVYDYAQTQAAFTQIRQQLDRELRRKLTLSRTKLEQQKMRLRYLSPQNRLNENRRRTLEYEEKLAQAMNTLLKERRHQLSLLAGTLESYSPAKKLSMGYAFVQAEDGHALRSVKQVEPKDEITVHLLDGEISATVLKKNPKENK